MACDCPFMSTAQCCSSLGSLFSYDASNCSNVPNIDNVKVRRVRKAISAKGGSKQSGPGSLVKPTGIYNILKYIKLENC